MSKKRALTYFVTIFLLIAFVSACNMPSASKETEDVSGLVHTVAAQTVEAQLTSDAAISGGQGSDPNNLPEDPGEGQSPSITPSQTESLESNRNADPALYRYPGSIPNEYTYPLRPY